MLINLKPRDARTLSASQIIRRIQRETASLPGITLYMQPAQDLTHRFDGQPHAVPVRAREPQPGRLQRLGAAPDGPHGADPRDHRRRHRAAEQGPGDVHQDRPRRGGALRHHRGHDRQPALRRLRPAHRLDGLHPVEPVSRDLRGRAADGPHPRLAPQPLSAGLGRRQAGAAVGGRHLRGAHRAAAGSIGWASSRPPPISFNLAPGASLGQAVDAIVAAQKEIGMPRQIQTHFQGAALAFQKALDSQLHADPGGDRHRLHRAGRALRELHPSDHDPLDPALGRHRRAAGADDGRRRSQRRRHHRHRAADRHRQEERDHDDRLRARCRAQRGQGAAARRSTRPACCASGRS